MFKYFVFLMILGINLKISAQSVLNNALKVRMAERTLEQKFTLLVKGNISLLKKNANQFNYNFNYHSGDIASLTLGIDALTKLIENKMITRAEFIEARKQTLNDTMLVRNRIKGVKSAPTPLPQTYDGNGVVVGIIDTGTDWRHNDFKDAFGNTRIQFLWDQKYPIGPLTPAPFGYGQEWTAAQINASLCPHDDAAGSSHGTHVSGIAAGNGLATGKNEGCAPKADLVVVALDFGRNGPTIADAVKYIYSKSSFLGKPCVINASVGEYYGSHDGTDLEAKLIENEVKDYPGRVMVAAAGNGGLIRFHTKTQPPVNDTSFTWITNANSNLFYWCYADTQQIKNVKFSVGANRTNYFNLGRIPFKNYNYGLQAIQSDTLRHNGNRIGIVKMSASINSYGVYELFISIKADTTGLLWRIESKGNGLHHAWNFDFKGTGLPSVNQYPRMSKYVAPDTLLSMVSGFQNLDDVITVANYTNLKYYYDYNNALQMFSGTAGAMAGSSSLGPTRDGRQKPDVSATGEAVFSSLCVSMQANFIANIPQFLSPGGQHVIGGGTSAASPVVAGFAALYLQSNPFATSMQAKKVISFCAYNDSFTGNFLPNYHWGYGKLDGVGSMLCYATGLNSNLIIENPISASPNPFDKSVNVQFKKVIEGNIYVHSSDGKLIFSDKVSDDHYLLDHNKLPEANNGLLFIHVVSPETNSTIKVVKSL